MGPGDLDKKINSRKGTKNAKKDRKWTPIDAKERITLQYHERREQRSSKQEIPSGAHAFA
jgi:hypothetical protein